MLVLTLNEGERVIIAGILFISVQHINPDKLTVALGFVGPREINIVREEVLRKKGTLEKRGD